MNKRFAVLAALVFLSAQVLAWQGPAAKAPAKAPAKAGWTPPKTAWGDPDLRGTYTSDNSIGVPFARPPQFGVRALLNDEEYAARERGNEEQVAKDLGEFPETPFGQDAASNNAPRHWLERGFKLSRASSIVIDPPDGRIPPMTPEGERQVAVNRANRSVRGEADSYTDRSNYDRCITRGVVGSVLPAIYGNGTSITQGPGHVVIRNEMIHEARVVPLDSTRPRLGRNIRLYMGDPRGRWEGQTLVVESTNFTTRTGLGGGAIHSEALTLTERFTKTAPDTVRYQFTVDDPVTYTKPWTAALDLHSKNGYEIYEYACHEGNYGLANMLSAARADEKAGQTTTGTTGQER